MRTPDPGLRRLAAGVLSAALLAGGLTLTVAAAVSQAGPPAPPPVEAAPVGVPAPVASPAGPTPAAGLPRSVPVRLDIPAVAIHTALMQVGLKPDGTMAVPPLTRGAPAGWYRHLASPGETGPAVIVGHVDTARFGRAVFYRLGALRPGDVAEVRRADGRTARFTVTAVHRYPKTAFPTDAVYGSTSYPALRLVTCGGTFDRKRRHYRDVVVVYAQAASTDKDMGGTTDER